jgi:hypothetical protein
MHSWHVQGQLHRYAVFWQPYHCVITKQTTLIQCKITQVYFNLFGYPYIYATCFGQHIGHHLAYQHKNHTKKDTVKVCLYAFIRWNKFELLCTSCVWPSCLNMTSLAKVLNSMAEPSSIYDLIKWSKLNV